MNFITPRAEPLIREIPLSRLALAPENVRKTPPDPRADAEIKASIAALGLLENLVVRTDALESLHRSLRKVIKTRGSFPSDEAASRQPHLTLGGYRIDLAPGPDGARPQEDAYTGSGRDLPGLSEGEPGESVTGSMTGRDLLSSSSFLFTVGEDASGRWSGWASTAPLGFAEARGTPGEGRLELLGADYAYGRLLAGVALSHGSGAGGRMSDGIHGIGASLYGVHSYLRLAVDDRSWIWSTFGFWTGDITLREGDGSARSGPPGRRRAGLVMSMAAVGAGGALLTADEADGFAVSAKADAYAMRIGSGAVTVPGGGDPPEAELGRLRLGLDGSRVFRLGHRRSLAASIGVGLVRGGDQAAARLGTDRSQARPGRPAPRGPHPHRREARPRRRHAERPRDQRPRPRRSQRGRAPVLPGPPEAPRLARIGFGCKYHEDEVPRRPR